MDRFPREDPMASANRRTVVGSQGPKSHGWQSALRLVTYRVLLPSTIILTSSGLLRAQAAVEYGGAVSKSATIALPAKSLVPADSEKTASLAHLPPHAAGSTEEANRRALESHAGKDGAKLMLRSVPTKADVRIDGKLVGTTPLLLVLAPGAYKVTLDGERMSSAQRQVDLLPRETREVVLPLESRYPAHIQLR
jgi:hypothetical protein